MIVTMLTDAFCGVEFIFGADENSQTRPDRDGGAGQAGQGPTKIN